MMKETEGLPGGFETMQPQLKVRKRETKEIRSQIDIRI